MEQDFIEHPLIKTSSVERRDYQTELAEKCLKENILVVLPTGLGKTVIALLTIAEYLKVSANKKCLLLAPTRPLTYQHHKFLVDHLEIPPGEISAITGEDSLETRRTKWTKKVICATPQVTHRDLDRGLMDFTGVSVVIFDEAHRAVGNYSYTVLGSRLVSYNRDVRIVGITASLPHGEDKTKEILRSLSIPRIEVKDRTSQKVKPFVQKTGVEWVSITLPPIIEKIRGQLKTSLRGRLTKLKNGGFLKSAESARFKTLLSMRGHVRESGNADLWRALLSAIRLTHALNLIETQNIMSLVKFLGKQLAEGRGGDLAADADVFEAYEASKGALALGIEHPKINKLKESLRQLGSEDKAIIFTSYRDSVDAICRALESSSFSFGRLLGKGGKGGQSQSQQIKTLEELNSGVFNILVATQVGEEGLDVAECNLVIFYDNVPSAVRFVQRRGRTGRIAPGKIVVFITKGTRDEAYYWSGRRKLKEMSKVAKQIGGQEGPLDKFVSADKEAPLIYVDSRETSSLLEELKGAGCKVEVRTLDVGDIVPSTDLVLERKTVQDFEKSVIDGRLFKQLGAMRDTYPRAALLLQGNRKDVASIGSSAFFGALASALSDFQVPIFTTADDEETSKLVYHIARREQREKKREIRVREGKRVSTLSEMQKFVVAGLPGVNTVLANRILKKLESLERIFSAEEDDLKTVDGVGEKLAAKIRQLSSHSYDDSS